MAEIDAANGKWMAAFNAGNAAALAALYTDTATLLPPGAPVAKKQAAIQAFWAGAIRSGLKNGRLEAQSVESYGRTGREIGRFSVDAPAPGGQTAQVEGKYLVIWKKVHGAWKLDADIWNANR